LISDFGLGIWLKPTFEMLCDAIGLQVSPVIQSQLSKMSFLLLEVD